MSRDMNRVLCAVTMLLLTGCSGNGRRPSETTTGQRYVEALVTGMYSDGFDLFPEEEGRCAAKGWVDIIGTDALVQAGISPEQFGTNHDLTPGSVELTKQQENAVIDLFYGCVDLSTAQFGSCFGTGLDHSAKFRDFIAAELLGTNQECKTAARASKLIRVSCLGGE